MAKRKLLIAAVVVGALAALLLFLYADNLDQKTKDTLGDQVEVVKASRDIPSGTSLEKDLITTEMVPRRFLPPNPIFTKDVDFYLGTPLEVNVQSNSMILTSDFAKEDVSRDLSSKIPLGERALSIPVDAISGVSGLMTPGDRVDILGTFPTAVKEERVRGETGEEESGFVTMTLLQNVTLLAVGTELSSVTEEKRHKQLYATVTVSVTVEESELLTIAQTRGKLMFLLRNREDIEVKDVLRKTLREVLLDLELMQEKRNKVRKKTKRVKCGKGKKRDPNNPKKCISTGPVIIRGGGK